MGLLVRNRAALAPSWVKSDLWKRARAVPSLDLNFADSKSLVDATTGANLVTFTRASSGTYVDSQGVIRTATNDAPRFDHNPTTGESLGLLVEEARTNSIRNNTMVGAVAGTPGTLPTNWAQNNNTGLSFSVSGVGVENGINYVEFTLSGTTASSTQNNVFFESSGAVAATNNQTWASSVFCRVVSSSNISGYSLGINDNVSFTQTTIVPTATYQRFSVVRTTGGSGVTSINTYLQVISPPAPATVSLVIRIGLPQLEQGAFATSVIPTSGTAATRSADVCSLSGSSYSSWASNTQGTVYSEFMLQAGAVSLARTVVNFNNVPGSDQMAIFAATGNTLSQNAWVSGSSQGRLDSGSPSANTPYKSAFSYSSGSRSFAVNGSSPVSVSAGQPTSNRLDIGNYAGNVYLSGSIKRIVVWPNALPSALQELTR